MNSPLSRRLRVAALAGATPLALCGLTGCSGVHVPAGPHAASSECAQVIGSLPDTLLGLVRTETDAQGTAAWGHGDTAIVLRCGVTPPPPTTDLCTTLETRSGEQVDWIVKEDSATATVLFTSYGRKPAVDISVPRKVAPDQPSAAALDLGGVVSPLTQTGRCLAPGDVS